MLQPINLVLFELSSYYHFEYCMKCIFRFVSWLLRMIILKKLTFSIHLAIRLICSFHISSCKYAFVTFLLFLNLIFAISFRKREFRFISYELYAKCGGRQSTGESRKVEVEQVPLGMVVTFYIVLLITPYRFL